MIFKNEIIGNKKSGEAIFKKSLNVDFWKNCKKPLSIVLDEAHTILNARRSMQNIVINDWIALIRRVLGQDSQGCGELVLISQLTNRIDIIARNMSTQIRFHICHFTKSCKKCGFSWSENSNFPEPVYECKNCGSYNILKHNHIVEVYHFDGVASYDAFRMFGSKSYHKHYFVNDIENYFDFYDTLQWDNLISDV
jgi:hypothetical protein